MTTIAPKSPEVRKALTGIINNEAELIFTRAQHLETQAKALHQAASILFCEADKLELLLVSHAIENRGSL